MHDAIRTMLDRYALQTGDDCVNALREILQELALLGLWRSKFFEHAAFYGGTALRVLHGLDRYSEDIDFSLLAPDPGFSLGQYGESLAREIGSFGFRVEFEQRAPTRRTAIESAFLKADTLNQLLVIEADPGPARRPPSRVGPEDQARSRHRSARRLRDREPLSAAPHSVCGAYLSPARPARRQAARHPVPEVGDARQGPGLVRSGLVRRPSSTGASEPSGGAHEAVGRLPGGGTFDEGAPDGTPEPGGRRLDVDRAREDVIRFVRDPRNVEIWSKDFFFEVVQRIES